MTRGEPCHQHAVRRGGCISRYSSNGPRFRQRQKGVGEVLGNRVRQEEEERRMGRQVVFLPGYGRDIVFFPGSLLSANISRVSPTKFRVEREIGIP